MALAVDNTGSGINILNQIIGGTTTISFTTGSGSDRLLIVNISTWNNGGTGTGCSIVVYGLQSMTLVTGSGATNGQFYTEQWVLIAPATGTANIVATVAGKTDKLGLAAVSFTGADQITGIDINTNTTGTSDTVTASLTTSISNEYLTDCVSHLSANNPTSHTGTQIYSDATNGTSTASQYDIAAIAGSNSMTWIYPDPGDAWAYSVLAVKASGGAGATQISRLALMGVG